MPLKLRVISDQYKQLGKASSQLFGVEGGNIGRAPDNDWVLPDPDRYVSSRHAKVAFRGGNWLLEDVSTNGVFVNDSDTPLSVSGPRKLKDGDRLRFGDYDIVVSIDDGEPAPVAAPSPPTRSAVKSSRSLTDQADYLRRGTFRNHDENRAVDRMGRDLGAELDITGLLVSGSRDSLDANNDELDAVAAFDKGLQDKTAFSPGSRKPAGQGTKVSSATASLLDDFLQEDLPKAAAPGDASDDWHMNTRRLQQRKATASAAPLLQVVPPATHSASPARTARDVLTPILRSEPALKPEPQKIEQPRPELPRSEPNRFEQNRSEPGKSELTRPEPPKVTPRIEPERRRTADTHSDMQAGVEALCRGAGIDPASLPADAHGSLLTLAGQLVREVVLDLMEALRNRGDHKNRLQLSQTAIQPNQNNPLKLSASVEDALRKLLDGHNTRNLGAVEAVREAFTDLKNHQLGIDAGMNAALNDLLGRVDPTELQQRFDQGLKRNAPQATINKGKYWELFTDFYPLLNQRDARGWPAVFTEEFTRAYVAKVDELENAKKR